MTVDPCLTLPALVPASSVKVDIADQLAKEEAIHQRELQKSEAERQVGRLQIYSAMGTHSGHEGLLRNRGQES